MAKIRLAGVNELSPGSMKKMKAGDIDVLLANIGGRFYAVDAICPHMGADLSTGTLEGNILTCPRHGSQYEVSTGLSVRGPKVALIRLKGKNIGSYPTSVESSDVFINI